MRPPGGADPARGTTGESAVAGFEEQGDCDHPDDFRRHRESLSVAAFPESRCKGSLRAGPIRLEEPDHRATAGWREGAADQPQYDARPALPGVGTADGSARAGTHTL